MVTRETECPSQPPFSSYLHKMVDAIGEGVLPLHFSTTNEFKNREEYFIFTETQQEGHSNNF